LNKVDENLAQVVKKKELLDLDKAKRKVEYIVVEKEPKK